MVKIGLYLMGAKGYSVLSTLIDNKYSCAISFVVAAKDKSVIKDYYYEIETLAKTNQLQFFNKNQVPDDLKSDYDFAISWRWLIKNQTEKLIVFHDSLLPKYRGFTPLVTALIEGDEEIGVTAIKANAEFDRGNIIGQEHVQITYPIKIKDAIDTVSILYGKLMLQVLISISNKEIQEIEQDENSASYSIWRDEEDYFIDWSLEAKKIKRFIDAVGFPYQGAKTNSEGTILRIFDAEELPDKLIVNRTHGKILYMNEGNPVIVCGKGLLLIKNVYHDGTNKVYTFKKLRIRFKNEYTVK